ncbi:MAG: condensation domain-containing protein [Rhodococcus sp. (in: high G+C Gram-positive bacteria)]|uniref:condensation domain-containing protein n=1 Tax=Rhodococcus sp. TaxID=1831 RepID=UPI002AD62BCB|nr:condensation domain-containing protein [Rhodococcus sp. (in: high G+C Gram-positive bacteria)]MDZ7930478.1 condensation domain-containing protein [Rhodococcus sp. (in: high G+C Gram-positive bacteria)]
MKFTEIGDYQLSGGRVTKFSPQADSGTFRWEPDDRPLAYDHETYVLRAASGRGGSSWLGAAFEVEGQLDTEAMNRALLVWHRRHEAFRTTATVAVDGAGDQHLVRRTCAPDRLSFGSTDLGWIEPDAIATTLADMFDAELSPLQWPHCMVVTITDTPDRDAAEDRFLLLFAADHSVMDAYSMLLSIGELSRLYDAEVHSRSVELTDIGSHVDFSVRSRTMGNEVTGDHEAVERWRQFLATTGGFPELSTVAATRSRPSFVGPVDALQQGWALPLADGEQVGAVNAVCRAAGHTTQTAVMAAMALAHRRLTGQPTLRLAMPLHTRDEARFLESVGWYVGIGPLEVDVRHARTFGDALNAAATGISEAKKLSRVPFPRVAELLGTSAEPQFVVSYLDLRFVAGASDWTTRRAQTLRSAARSESEVYIWVARTAEGITVSARHPADEAASMAVTELVVSTFETLFEVIDTGIEALVGSPVGAADVRIA